MDRKKMMFCPDMGTRSRPEGLLTRKMGKMKREGESAYIGKTSKKRKCWRPPAKEIGEDEIRRLKR